MGWGLRRPPPDRALSVAWVLAAVMALLGPVAASGADHRLDVGDLASGAKKRLWLIIYLGTAVVGLVCWAAFQ